MSYEQNRLFTPSRLIAQCPLLIAHCLRECTFCAAVRNWALDTGLRLVLNRESRKNSSRSFFYDNFFLC